MVKQLSRSVPRPSPPARGYWFNRLIYRLNWRHLSALPYAGRVLDLGCGSAPYKELILQQADEYIGVDWHHSQHDQSRVDVFADLTKPLPFPADYADTVVAFQVLEHLPEPDAFLAECRRVLRPDGMFHLATPFMWRIHEAPYDYYRFTRHGLEYLLQKHGFTHLEVRPFTGFWQMWVLKFNYHTVRWAHGPLKYLWAPIWYLDQWLTPILDCWDPCPEETTSYLATAQKPGPTTVPRNLESQSTRRAGMYTAPEPHDHALSTCN